MACLSAARLMLTSSRWSARAFCRWQELGGLCFGRHYANQGEFMVPFRIALRWRHPSNVTARHVGPIAAALACLFCSGVTAAEQCWAPDALQAKAGEEQVNLSTPKALVAPPKIPLQPIRQSPYSWRGALRRVDLTKGGQKAVALTFDLCEQPHEITGYQGKIVDFLRKERIHATFFAGGKWLLTHEQRAQQLMTDRLFEIGNHTWEHRNLRLLSGSALEDEIWNANLAFRQVRNKLSENKCLDRSRERPAHTSAPEHMTLFRFPFGACDPESLHAVNESGLRAVQWDVSSADPSKTQTGDKMARDVLQRVRPGSIVLFHANGRGWHTAEALPLIVAGLKKDGYEFLTVSELLALPGAKPEAPEECYDARPKDTERYDALAKALTEKHAAEVARLRLLAKKSGVPEQPKKELPWLRPK